MATVEFSLAEIERKLADPAAYHQTAARAALVYLRRQGPLARALAVLAEAGPEAAALWVFGREGRALAGNALFLQSLRLGIVMDVEIESLLTAVRRHLILNREPSVLEDQLYAAFVVALIVQLHYNEFVWFVASDEREALATLAAMPADWRSPAYGRALMLAALYQPVAELLAACPKEPAVLKALDRGFGTFASAALKAQREETAIALGLPLLTPITDEVSRGIADQYHDHPYPRWQSVCRPAPDTARKMIGAYFPPEELAFFDRPFNVLITGCGTGGQAIERAYAYGTNADILAVDLSRQSLAYAVRKTRQHRLPKLRFALADILELGGVDQRFEIIECAGVLHHLADPAAGLRILAQRLAPGGMMYVGLYSTLARQAITEVRQRIASEGLGSDPDTLRSFRRRLFDDPAIPILLKEADDLFTLSTFHDLLFNLVEHTFTVPDIAALLAAANLTFKGFMAPPDVGNDFWRQFPDPARATDLAAWAAFEAAKPDAFRLMYHLWCG